MSTRSKTKVTSGGRQLSVQVKCNMCKNKVDPKNTITCLQCKKAFEFDCIGYSEKLHRLKDSEARNMWKCKSCQDKISHKLQTPDPEPSFVRTRKKQLSPTPSHRVLSSPDGQDEAMFSTPRNSTELQDSHITLDNMLLDEPLSTSDKLLQRSMDCTVTNTIAQAVTISEMKDTISHLQLQLASSQNELENYILENNNLRSQNTKLTNENNALKKLCLSPLRENRIIRNTPSKPQIQKHITTEYDYSTLQNQIITLKQQLIEAEKEILKFTEQIRTLEAKLSEKNATHRPNDSTYQVPNGKNGIKKACGDRLLIYGSQQCIGLSSALIHSRQETMYENYKVTGHIKPYALAADILKDCHNNELTPNDKIIVCIGENDYDMKILLLQLRNLLNRFKKNDIIVLNVLKNMYLDVNDLTYNIRNICQEYKTCHFISCNMTNLAGICKSINFIVDCIDYDKKYLDIVNLKKLIVRNQTSGCTKKTRKIFKGTIPYYFAPISLVFPNSSQGEKLPTNNTKKIITDYFPIVKKQTKLFRVKNT